MDDFKKVIHDIKNVIEKWYVSLPLDKQKITKSCIRVFVASFLLILLWSANTKASNYNAFHTDTRSFFYYLLLNFSQYPISILFSMIVTFCYVIFFYKGNDIRNDIKYLNKNDDKNLEVMKKKTGGTAEDMSLHRSKIAFTQSSLKELEMVVEQTKKKSSRELLEDANNPYLAPILGRMMESSDSERKIVYFKPKPYQTILNCLLNVLVLGVSGSGKSYVVSRNMANQAIMRGESVFFNDPSAELYSSGAQMYSNRGLDVKILNLVDLSHSDSWNCIKECINDKTGRVDASRVGMFATVFVMNSETGQKEEAFWKQQSIGYLKAAIAYVAYLHENAILTAYKMIFDKVSEGIDNASIISNRFKEMIPLTWCEKMIQMASYLNGYSLDEVTAMSEQAKIIAPRFSLKEVIDVLQSDTEMEKMNTFYTSGNCPKQYFGLKAYGSVRRADTPSSIIESAMTTLRVKLSIFDDEILLFNLSHDGIDTKEFNAKQSVYYLSEDTQETTLKPIGSLFVTFLLRNAQLTYNEAERLAEETGKKNERLPITVILDEAPALGLIGGSQEWFPLFLANSRKAGCKTVTMAQTIAQLNDIYGENQMMSIESNSKINMILAVNDEMTARYVRDFLCGEATYLQESHHISVGVTNRYSNDEVSVSSTSGKLRDTSSIRRLEDKVLLVMHGEQPIELEPFPYPEHPMSKEIIFQSVTTAIPSFYQKQYQEKLKLQEQEEIDFEKMIAELKHYKISDDEKEKANRFFQKLQFIDPEEEFILYDAMTGEMKIDEKWESSDIEDSFFRLKHDEEVKKEKSSISQEIIEMSKSNERPKRRKRKKPPIIERPQVNTGHMSDLVDTERKDSQNE